MKGPFKGVHAGQDPGGILASEESQATRGLGRRCVRPPCRLAPSAELSSIEAAATWSAVLAPDGDSITFGQTYAGGHTLAWPCPRTMSYAEATDEGPHPLAWLTAARLLGLPFPGEEGAGG